MRIRDRIKYFLEDHSIVSVVLFAAAAALFLLWAFPVQAQNIVTSSGVWYRSGAAMLLNPDTLTIGASGDRIAAVYADTIDGTTVNAGTLSVSGATSGDLTIQNSTPALFWQDSDAGDGDASARMYASCTDTGSGTEDCDVAIGQQVAGAMTDFMTADADGSLSFSGDIGIGVTDPDYELDVAGDVGLDAYLYHNGDPDTRFGFTTDKVIIATGGENLLVMVEDETQDYIRLGDGGDVDIQLYGGSSDALFVQGSSGYVGVGTIAPSYELDAVGDARVSGRLSFSGRDPDETYSGKGYGLTGQSPEQDGGAAIFWGSGSYSGYFFELMRQSYAVLTNGHISTTGDLYSFRNTYLGDTSADTVRIRAGETYYQGIHEFVDYDATSNTVMSIDAPNRRIGIGTAAPAYELDVNGGMRVTGTAGIEGDATFSAEFRTEGSRYANLTQVNAATYDVGTADQVLAVDYTDTGTVSSLTLPTAQCDGSEDDGREIAVKDTGGGAGTYPIVIDTEGSEDIDGAATLTIDVNYDLRELFCYSSDWYVR